MPRVTDEPTDRLLRAPFVVAMASMALYFTFAGMLIPTLPLYVERSLGGGEAAIGLTFVAFAAAAVAVRPLITWIGERWGRRSLIVWGCAIASVAGMLLAVTDEIWQVMPLRALMGIGEAGLFVGASALTTDLSPPERRAEAASYLSAALFVGITIGPVLGELLMGDDHFDRAFVIAGAMSGIGALVGLLAPQRVGPPPSAAAVARPTWVWIHPSALLPGIVLALAFAAWSAFNAFVPTYVEDLGMAGSAPVFVVYSVVCLVLRLVAARLPERLGLARAVNSSLVMIGLGLLVIAAVARVPALYVGALMLAFGITFFYPALLAASVNAVAESQRVAVISSFTMFFEIGTASGGLVLGLVGEAMGKRATFAAGALIAAVGVVVLNLVLLPALRRAPGEHGAVAAAAS